MIPLPPAESSEINAFETIARLTFSLMQNEHFNNTHTQPIYINSTPTNKNVSNSPQNDNVAPTTRPLLSYSNLA